MWIDLCVVFNNGVYGVIIGWVIGMIVGISDY